MYDYAVFIGRFQPFHRGHLDVIKEAHRVAKNVIVCIGSANKPRSFKNPFTYDERKVIIQSVDPTLFVTPINDNLYNDTQWAIGVQEQVQKVIASQGWTDYPPRITLIGYEKDESSFYLKMFPRWPLTLVDAAVPVINATDIRHHFYTQNTFYNMPTKVLAYVLEWQEKNPDLFKDLADEYRDIVEYKKSWESAPYPPTFVTTDAVVVQDAHILLVQRGMNPGKGLWALPGGFLGQKENIFDGCIRELYEETGIKVQEKIVRRALANTKVFDHPNRSSRGRTITFAYYFALDSVGSLPKVRGMDDAAEAKWVPLADFKRMENQIFEDHFHIVNYFI